MSYWSTETLITEIPSQGLITPFNEGQIQRCAYELMMGPEAFITATDGKLKTLLKEGECIIIPPGQFALLLTEEVVKVPLNAIAFISMRFGVKQKGLINVSGFHVDPGFAGRLKFSVYNAGSREITITRADRIFMIWYSYLDHATNDGYPDCDDDQNTISSNDQNLMHGEVASPSQLKKEIDGLKHSHDWNKWLLQIIIVLLIGIVVRYYFMEYQATVKQDDIQRLRSELSKEIVQELKQTATGSYQPVSEPNEQTQRREIQSQNPNFSQQ
ncbi:MAG: hypothetical protein N0E44_07780 [Candidatus Thiodiazotropha lotti]|nr:hypothetical protein [Candidatus Thiodiazotropha lotti]MCW4219776.1 hypothetical protein [Candidatus Thiodiazotropha lotti]